jgi:hypothetical protein
MNEDQKLFRAAVRKANKARKAKVIVTCPASRHVQMMAEYIGARKPYSMIGEEPEHCAESMLSVVASLYWARARIAELEGITLDDQLRASTAKGKPLASESGMCSRAGAGSGD